MKVVIGPPGAGKSTYVRERMKFGDLVVDVDELFRALTLRPMWEHPPMAINAVLSVRDHVIENLRPAWVVSTNARADYREGMRERYEAEVVVLETPAAVCLARIEADGREGEWGERVARWWEEYERDERDEVITNDELRITNEEANDGD